MRPPQMGYGYAYVVPGHIGDLRSEAFRRNEAIDIKENLNFTGGYRKYVYTIKQGPEQIERALKGERRATELHLKPSGELIQLVIEDYLVIYSEPLSLPHRHRQLK